MDRRVLLLIALAGAVLPGCLCSAVIDPDPALMRGGGEPDGGSCDDGVDCTFDRVTDDGQCAHEPDDLFCGEGRLCFPAAGCIPLRPCARDEDCADGNLCTVDDCDSDRRACAPAEPTDCGNGVFCDGDEACSPLVGCLPSPAPRDCRDAVDCTTDSCSEEEGACVHVPNHEICGDARGCNGEEICDPTVGCLSGTAACADNGDCAPEVCLEDLGGGPPTCQRTPDHQQCAWGKLCVGEDGEQYECDEIPCTIDDECDDGDGCNGTESCGKGGVCVAAPGLLCDDGFFCNGAEVCVDSACVSDLPPTCEDGVACTADRCDEDADACAHDPDSVACLDPSFCNGAEVCTETGCGPAPGFDCEDGTECTVNSCDEDADLCRADPSPELCNAADEDCDGEIDEGFECALGTSQSCVAACSGAVGTQLCGAACGWMPCQVTEDCNGVDDDCNGEIDEGCGGCTPEESGTCTTTCSTTGTRTCLAGGTWGPCMPPPDACNSIDDDCNGVPDDPFECVLGTVEGGCLTTCNSSGFRVCAAGCSWGPCLPPGETCNGVDDDCDEENDDGFDCVQGAPSQCTTACATTGTSICTDVCTPGGCVPPAESCNGLDDDCDGTCDEDYGCCAGTYTDFCVTACNSIGLGLCGNDCQGSTCVAGDACNGIDDDCNGDPDDGPGRGDCQAYVEVETCMIAAGVRGQRTCTEGCAWDRCCGLSEVCDNGEDDDCNGEVDEAGCCVTSAVTDDCSGFDDDCNGLCDDDVECCLGEVRYCLTSCNTIGLVTCEGGCTWGQCVPPGEACGNLIDDDCDALVDEGDCV